MTLIGDASRMAEESAAERATEWVKEIRRESEGVRTMRLLPGVSLERMRLFTTSIPWLCDLVEHERDMPGMLLALVAEVERLRAQVAANADIGLRLMNITERWYEASGLIKCGDEWVNPVMIGTVGAVVDVSKLTSEYRDGEQS